MAETTVLGIDLGTTTVKVIVADAVSGQVLDLKSRETVATLSSSAKPTFSEQDVAKIVASVDECVADISLELRKRVRAIGVCGQMHGLVMWKCRERTSSVVFTKDLSSQLHRLSCLYTWQDGRCSPEFLASMPRPRSHLRVATGFGCATMMWLAQHEPGSLEVYECAGTVQDFLVAVLCGLDRPIMSVQNAASWGYFDTVSMSWNAELLNAAGFPVRLLPKVVDAGQIAGHLSNPWNGIDKGIPVTAALGDLQCYMLSKLEQDSDAVINIGTSSQFTFIMPEEFNPMTDISDASSPVEYVPYFNGRYLSETASLNGGNALASFVMTVCSWMHELGLEELTESEIWKKIGLFVNEPLPDSVHADTDILINPIILGERHDPERRFAEVLNARPSNASLCNIARAVSRGVVANLRKMSPRDLPVRLKRIVGCGGALERNAVMRRSVVELFELPLDMVGDKYNADSAVGAAQVATRLFTMA